MGLYLEDEINIKSIFLRYLKGSIIVEGTEYAITDAASQQDGTEKSFDFEFVINESHPAENISNLTEIQVLLES